MLSEILDQRVVYLNPGRTLDNQALMEFLNALDAIPEISQGRYDILVDLSQLEEVQISSDHISRWAFKRNKVVKSHQSYKIAAYSSAKLGFGMARMFEAIFSSDESPVQTSVYDDLEEALAWLKLLGSKKRILSLGKRAAIPLKLAEPKKTG